MDLHRRITSSAGLLAGVAALLTAGIVVAAPGPDLPARDVAAATMPLDAYVVSTGARDSYAEDLLTQPCLAEAGYPRPVPREPAGQRSASYGAQGTRLFTPELAAAWGYRDAPLPAGPAADALAEATARNGQALPAEEEAALRACLDEVRSGPLPTLPGSAQGANLLVAEAADAAEGDPAAARAAERWRACMEPLGIADLPATPRGMPSAGLQDRFGLALDGAAAEAAGADEVGVATADAGCRASSGWAEARYDAVWDAQVDVLTRHADELADIRATLDAHEARVSAVIAEHAPAS